MQNKENDSNVLSVTRTLEEKREEALLVYVHEKVLLFADPNSNPKVLFYGGCKRNSVPRDVDAAHKNFWSKRDCSRVAGFLISNYGGRLAIAILFFIYHI